MTDQNSDPNAGNSDMKIDEPNTGALDAGDAPKAPQDWPEDWREKTAEAIVGKKEGDDYTKEIKRLQRLNSPVETYKSFRELEKKFSTIKQAPELPKDATPEQVAEYRKAAGIPEKAEGYNEHLKDIPLSDELKPIVGKYIEDMHGHNVPPDVVKASVASYLKLAEAQQQAMLDADEEARQLSRNELREEWGGEYKTNFNAIDGVLEQYPALKEALAFGRGQGGIMHGHDARVLRDLAMLARELNPLHTIVTSGTGDKAQLVQDEIKHLEGLMGVPNSEYWSGPNAQKNQERYRELVGKVGTK